VPVLLGLTLGRLHRNYDLSTATLSVLLGLKGDDIGGTAPLEKLAVELRDPGIVNQCDAEILHGGAKLPASGLQHLLELIVVNGDGLEVTQLYLHWLARGWHNGWLRVAALGLAVGLGNFFGVTLNLVGVLDALVKHRVETVNETLLDLVNFSKG